jgi:hypothetical protein
MEAAHPDAEVLAAWFDQGLGEAERREIEAHVAACDDCRVLLAHVLELQDELGAANGSSTGSASVGTGSNARA